MTEEELVKLILDNIKLSTTRAFSWDRVHVTDLYDFCPRRYAYAYIHQRPPYNINEKLPYSLRVTFKLGQAIESIVAESLSDYLVGSISTNKDGFLSYRAPVFRYPVGKFSIVGHPDILVHLNGKRYILEVKSINHEEFKNLQAPLFKHVYQAMGYLALKEKLKADIDNKAFIVYVSKGHTDVPIKIFPVTLSSQFKKTFNSAIRELKTFSKTGKLPEKICTNRYYPLAKDCVFSNICFKKKGGNNNESSIEQKKREKTSKKNS